MRGFYAIAALIFLVACADSRPLFDPSPKDRVASAERMAATNRMQHMSLKTQRFILFSAWRIRHWGEPVTVYIEGDGMAWADRGEPSADPTPIEPIALHLAASDTSANVIYLARPCQFEGMQSIACERTYWTDGRFARDVIDAYDEALTSIANTLKTSKIRLVGYSGGGGLALLVAAQRHDITDVRTVAGNIDHKAWTDLLHLSPLSHSYNAADYAAALTHIPQLHFVGAGDAVMPPAIAESYRKHFSDSHCVEIKTIRGVSHDEGWRDQWPSLLATPLPCIKN